MKWLYPAKCGIVLGVLVGSALDLWTELGHCYLEHHLYNTAARSLALRIDASVFAVSAVLYLLLLVLRYAAASSDLKRGPLAGISAGITLIVAAVLGLAQICCSDEGQAEILREIFSPDLLRYFLKIAVLVIVGPLSILWLKRSKLSKPGYWFSVGGRMARWFGPPAWLLGSSLVIIVTANLLALGLHARAAIAVRERPNIIFIMADTLRADHIRCYGYNRNTTPNIDKLAEDGIRFVRAVSQAPFTSWSVGSIMTSQYPQDIMANMGHRTQIPDSCPTLAEVLKDKGYNTSAIISNPAAGSSNGMDRGYDLFDESTDMLSISSPRVLSLGLSRLNEIKDKRFFLFLLFVDPHSPYILYPEYSFDPRWTDPLRFMHPTLGMRYLPEEVENWKAYYDSDVRFTDEHIGRFLDELKKQRLYENSLIVFFSDHGEEFLDHGDVFHGRTLYEEMLRVPLIVKLPGRDHRAVMKSPFAMLNLLPSVLCCIGLEDPALGLAGKEIDFGSSQRLSDETIFSAACMGENLRSATNQSYKYVYNKGKPVQALYDLLKDPKENQNILKAKPGVSAALRKAVLVREDWGEHNWRKPVIESSYLNENEKRRLRNLGYLAN